MTILFILAHPDDEAYGPAGTIAHLSKQDEVIVVSLCNGARPGSNHVKTGRVEAFTQSCELLGASSIIGDTNDCELKYDSTLSFIERCIAMYNPETVYTNNISDIHRDHRLVAECSMVACRPKPTSTVKKLYFCEIPSATPWSFGMIQPQFTPNEYRDITDVIELKKKVLGLYTTETYEFPDARSVEATEVLAKYRGSQSGFRYAEAHQLVFSRVNGSTVSTEIRSFP